MPAKETSAKPAKVNKITDAAVVKATGRTWPRWAAMLDKAGCRAMNHKQIVAVVEKHIPRAQWWAQMVTVGYEQLRGLREKHQKPDGYSISASKTLNVPLAKLYSAFADPRLCAKWLPESKSMTIRKATKNKSMRITWPGEGVKGDSSVSANFYAKGPEKSYVSLQHDKLKNAATAKRLKAWWAKAMSALQRSVEG